MAQDELTVIDFLFDLFILFIFFHLPILWDCGYCYNVRLLLAMLAVHLVYVKSLM
jgi:hypothetical protein